MSPHVTGIMVGDVATRPVFWHFVSWLKVVWYLLAVLSVMVFVVGIIGPVLRFRRGQGGPWPPCPWTELPGRLRRAALQLLAHTTIARRDPIAGWAHRAIFYGFVILFVGTVVLGFDTDFTDPVLGVSYFHGDFYLAYKETLNVFGTVLIIGLLVMMLRRALLRPAKLNYSRPDRAAAEPQFDRRAYAVGDWVFVGTLLVIALTGFLLEGVRIAMSQPGYSGTQFGGWLVAQLLTGLPHAALAGLRHGLWWFHGLLAITFVASIPYTKARHMVTSFASLTLKDPLAGRRLPQIQPQRADLPAGYATLGDFAPVHLLQLDACTKCGKCHEACPANATGRPLSPRDVILELHERSHSAGGRLGGVLGALMGSDPDSWSRTLVTGDDAVRSETVWSCMQCNACVEICPVGIEQAPIIAQLRRHLVEKGELDSNLQTTLETIHKTGNSFGENRRKRGRWTRELDFEVPDARKQPVDLLWFVGDYASFDPRSQQVSRSIARLLHAAEVNFGILYEAESNAGNDVRRVGDEGLFEELLTRNSDVISGVNCRRIFTSDPHSLNTLRNEYTEISGRRQVFHHTALLLDLFESGALTVTHPLSYRVTYHDPCHLGRLQGEYGAPRELLDRFGCTLVEMPRNRDNSFCCGAGGGQIWVPDRTGRERPSENRIREAIGCDGVELFVVACPKDVAMYEDAIKTSGNSERITLREIAELAEEAVFGELPGRLHTDSPEGLANHQAH